MEINIIWHLLICNNSCCFCHSLTAIIFTERNMPRASSRVMPGFFQASTRHTMPGEDSLWCDTVAWLLNDALLCLYSPWEFTIVTTTDLGVGSHFTAVHQITCWRNFFFYPAQRPCASVLVASWSNERTSVAEVWHPQSIIGCREHFTTRWAERLSIFTLDWLYYFFLLCLPNNVSSVCRWFSCS